MQGQGKCAWIETNEDSGAKEDVFNNVEWTELSESASRVNKQLTKFMCSPTSDGGKSKFSFQTTDTLAKCGMLHLA